MTFSETYCFYICFPEKKLTSYAMAYNKLMNYTFVNKDITFFSLPDPSRIWLMWLALCGLDGLLQPIITIYTNHYFNFFSVSKFFILCVFLLHLDFANVISCNTYILFYKILISYITQCVTRQKN